MNSHIINGHIINNILQKFTKKKYDFSKDIEIFEKAFIHESIHPKNNYQRLEFLGDSIIHLSLANYLYKRYNKEAQGFLTRLRIKIENCQSLASLSQYIGLDKYIKTITPITNSILEDVMESFIGALYLVIGLNDTSDIFIKMIEETKDFSEILFNDNNYKDILLRIFHQNNLGHPKYKNEYKNNELFRIKVIDDKNKIYGCSNSVGTKLEMEQEASKNSLINLNIIVNGIIDPDYEYNKKKEIETIYKSDNTKSRYNHKNYLFNKWILSRLFNHYCKKNISELNDINLYIEGLTHQSYTIKDCSLTDLDKLEAIRSPPFQKKSNCRMVFLGNAVIHFVIAIYLYDTYKNEDEGFLSRLRIKIENRKMLYYLGKKTSIYKYILFSSKIENDMNGRKNINIVSSGFEGFFSALYLDKGIKACIELMNGIIKSELDIELLANDENNYKDLLISHYRKHNFGSPKYFLEKITGPEHKKIFTMYLIEPFNHKKICANGSSKKNAEMNVAKLSLQFFK